MANNLIFRAADASTALEKVQEALGPDAYIIDINNVGNFVEITASKEEPVLRKPNKPVNPRKSLALAKEKLQQFSPESPQRPLGSKAFMDASVHEPFLDKVMYKNGEVSKQQDPSAENVFRDFGDTKKRSEKPLAVGTQSSNLGERESEQSQTITQTAPVAHSKPSPVIAEPLTLNATRSIHTKVQDTFVFGDLLNFGLNPAFIKTEFGLKEFDGSISRSLFTEKLVLALRDPRSGSVFDDFGNLVFLGTPGSGKSTICAKLMHYYGTQYSEKPSVLHVTPEKLFEADRLRFHAKMFNFPFSRKYTQDNAALCEAERQIVEIAWDYQMSFANYFAHHQRIYPSLKPFLVLTAEINHHTLQEVLRVCPMVRTVILNKCDFGRFSIRNLMMLYEKGYKIASLSGDRSVSEPLKMADAVMLHGFVEYTLDL